MAKECFMKIEVPIKVLCLPFSVLKFSETSERAHYSFMSKLKRTQSMVF